VVFEPHSSSDRAGKSKERQEVLIRVARQLVVG
jgi:hypothetical protein